MKRIRRIGLSLVLAVAMTIAIYFSVAHLTQESWFTINISPETNGTTLDYVDNNILDTLELDNGYGVFISRIKLDGLYPGWSGLVPLVIVNGEDRERILSITIEEPAKVSLGHESLPLEYLCWFDIEESVVSIPAGEYIRVPVVLAMPSNSGYHSEAAEIGIHIEDMEQVGMVKYALEARWCIVTT